MAMAIVPLASILVVLGLLAGVLWWLRRLGIAVPGAGLARGRGARLESLGKLTLGPQHNLHLVRVDGSVVLVACSPAGCALISHGEAGGADHRDVGGPDCRPIGAPGGSR
jgi:flagellar biogenesis protein FliO